MKTSRWLLVVPIFLVQSCIKKDFSGASTNEPVVTSMDNMQVDPGFTFNTGNNVAVKLTTLDNEDKAVPNTRINLYSDYPELGGQLIASCFTDDKGAYNGTVKLPAYADSIVLQTDAIGFVQWQKRAIASNQLECVYGGSKPVTYQRLAAMGNRPVEIDGVVGSTVIKSIGTINSLGVPTYLEKTNDVVDAAFLNDINVALPESKPVPSYHPEYLTNTNQTSLVLQQPANVWVTFVHEGAGYLNTLCYYKYDPLNPPTKASDIDTLYTIFPNVSYVNSGGGLVSGNKVKIGTFPKGAGIGWAIIANGYNNGKVNAGYGVYFSQTNLNPETSALLKQHCILLNDVNRGKLLLSFEDINRQNSGCDNDFNDAIFYVTADPITAIDITNVARPVYTKTDSDGDGVTDNFDGYPNDAAKAFDNFYPSQNTVGSLAFEDLWPSKGDYDFNDMVMDYNFNYITNGKNQVVELKAALTLKAIGASYHNGFGIQLPISTNLVAGVTGTDIRSNLISKNANGTEAGQSKATIIVFDDAFDQLPWPGSGVGVNTTAGAPYVQPKTINLTIKLVQPVAANVLGLPPYNPFIFVNKNRGVEVHLVNQPPTDLANTTLLGTQSDNSSIANNRYYVTSKNLPFAIDIAGPFEYPVEKKVVLDAHLKFAPWAQSRGIQYTDWFKPVTGYQNRSNIFSH